MSQVRPDPVWVASQVAKWGEWYNRNGPLPKSEPVKVVHMRIPSSRDANKLYDVAIYPDMRGECTCPAFTTYRRGLACSHIELAKEAIQSGGE